MRVSLWVSVNARGAFSHAPRGFSVALWVFGTLDRHPEGPDIVAVLCPPVQPPLLLEP